MGNCESTEPGLNECKHNGSLKSHHSMLVCLHLATTKRIHIHVHPLVGTVQQIEIGRRRIVVPDVVLLLDRLLVTAAGLLLMLAECRLRKVRTVGAEEHTKLALLHVLLEVHVRLVELVGYAGRVVALHAAVNGVWFVLDVGGQLLVLVVLLLLMVLLLIR